MHPDFPPGFQPPGVGELAMAQAHHESILRLSSVDRAVAMFSREGQAPPGVYVLLRYADAIYRFAKDEALPPAPEPGEETDWAQTARDLTSGDPERIKPHLPPWVAVDGPVSLETLASDARAEASAYAPELGKGSKYRDEHNQEGA